MIDKDVIKDKPLDGSKGMSDMSTEHRRRFIFDFSLKHSCLLSSQPPIF